MSPLRNLTPPRPSTLLIVALAVLIFAPRLFWGLPAATASHRVTPWATDTLLPLKPLAEMHNTFVVSKPDRQYGYPWFHYAVLAAVDLPYMGWLWLSGGLESGATEYPFGLDDPERRLRHLTIIGRCLTLLMAIGSVLAARAFAATLFGTFAGTLCAVLVILQYLMVYYAGTGNLEVPALFWTTLGLLVYARLLVDGATRRRFLWLGVWAGLAMATKDQAVVVFLPLALLLLFPKSVETNDSRARGPLLLWGLGASVLAYVAATGMLFDPARHLTHVDNLLFASEKVSGAAFYWQGAPGTFEGTLGLIGETLWRWTELTGAPATLLALVGVALAARRDRRLLGLLLPAPLLFLVLYRSTGLVIVRYLLPLTLVADAFAAFAVARLRDRFPRGIWITAATVAIVWRVLLVVDLSTAQLDESRDRAAAWFTENARDGEVVEFFGAEFKMPHLEASIASRRIAGRETWEGERDHGPRIRDHLANAGPEFVVILPDWTSPPDLPRSQDCPADVFDDLEAGRLAGYVRVAHFEAPEPFFTRPAFDSPAVSPPVRIYARADVARRLGR